MAAGTSHAKPRKTEFRVTSAVTLFNIPLSGAFFHATHMYLHCRLDLVSENVPNLTVISVHPQQGPLINSLSLNL